MSGQSLRILVVHPGASVSTADVHRGVVDGLRAVGHQVWEYALDGRIAVSARWLYYSWRQAKKQQPAMAKPTNADVLYHAGEQLVPRALRIMPDVVLIVSAMYLHPDVLVLLRRARLRVALLLTESPYDDEQQAKLIPWADVVWTNERTSARRFGIRYLPHAWHPAIHTVDGPDDPAVPAHDVVFVGTGFEERVALLEAIDFGDLDVGLYGSWDLVKKSSPLRRYIREGYIDNTRTAALYRRAKVGLNLYRTSMGFGRGVPKVQDAESLNPRAYELAATACFTISDDRQEVAEVFGDLVPTFRTAAEATDLIHRWVRDDAGRARIRTALPAAVAMATWHARAALMTRDLADSGIVALGLPQQRADGQPRGSTEPALRLVQGG